MLRNLGDQNVANHDLRQTFHGSQNVVPYPFGRGLVGNQRILGSLEHADGDKNIRAAVEQMITSEASQLAHQSFGKRGVIVNPESACGSKEVDRPLSRFPLRGQAGAGGFPPRRDTCRASQNRWHVPCGGSPHKRDCVPLVYPPLGRRLRRRMNFHLAEISAAR